MVNLQKKLKNALTEWKTSINNNTEKNTMQNVIKYINIITNMNNFITRYNYTESIKSQELFELVTSLNKIVFQINNKSEHTIQMGHILTKYEIYFEMLNKIIANPSLEYKEILFEAEKLIEVLNRFIVNLEKDFEDLVEIENLNYQIEINSQIELLKKIENTSSFLDNRKSVKIQNRIEKLLKKSSRVEENRSWYELFKTKNDLFKSLEDIEKELSENIVKSEVILNKKLEKTSEPSIKSNIIDWRYIENLYSYLKPDVTKADNESLEYFGNEKSLLNLLYTGLKLDEILELDNLYKYFYTGLSIETLTRINIPRFTVENYLKRIDLELTKTLDLIQDQKYKNKLKFGKEYTYEELYNSLDTLHSQIEDIMTYLSVVGYSYKKDEKEIVALFLYALEMMLLRIRISLEMGVYIELKAQNDFKDLINFFEDKLLPLFTGGLTFKNEFRLRNFQHIYDFILNILEISAEKLTRYSLLPIENDKVKPENMSKFKLENTLKTMIEMKKTMRYLILNFDTLIEDKKISSKEKLDILNEFKVLQMNLSTISILNVCDFIGNNEYFIDTFKDSDINSENCIVKYQAICKVFRKLLEDSLISKDIKIKYLEQEMEKEKHLVDILNK